MCVCCGSGDCTMVVVVGKLRVSELVRRAYILASLCATPGIASTLSSHNKSLQSHCAQTSHDAICECWSAIFITSHSVERRLLTFALGYFAERSLLSCNM